MGTETVRLTTHARILENGVRLVEAFGLPEISALSEVECLGDALLKAKAEALLEDSELSPPLSFFRRQFAADVELDDLEITLEPPKRQPGWETPVTLRLPFARWVEDALHQGWVPSLGVLVFAPRAALLPERLQGHVRLLLAGRQRTVTLRELARLARVHAQSLGVQEVAAKLQTARQSAVAEDQEERASSVLSRLAEELPPFVTGADPSTPAARPEPCAFEMEAELAQLAEALTGSPPRSVLLVAPAGAGKTALVHELARRRQDFSLAQTPFWSTSGARLMTGPIGFGMWQQRCQQMCREASTTKAIIHVGSLAELLEAGKANRSEQSIGGFLRPWIARDELTVIAECTPEQLGAIERIEPHLLTVFRQVVVPERTPSQARTILGRVFTTAVGQSASTPDPGGVDRALHRLHQLHQRYATYSAHPGRAVRFLKNLLADRRPDEAFSEAAVVAAFSRETGLPPVLLDARMPLDLPATGAWFSERVIGQPEAVAQVLDSLALIKARLARPRKPLGSFLFIGPTGTGKTEMAKALAAFLFGDAARLARFDLNEFGDPISVQRLIGGGWTGQAEGLLTAKVREQPFSVLLLDEFEKADPSLFDLLLQVLGEGRLTDAAGRVADFCNSVIVMTSNLGAREFQRGPAGFRAEGEAPQESREHFTSAVQRFLRPELFNRLDAVVPFRPLTPEVVLAIARRQLEAIRERDGLRLRPVNLEIDPAVAQHLAAEGYEPRYGARPLKRVIEQKLVVPLAEGLNGFAATTPLHVRVHVENAGVNIGIRAATREEGAAVTAAESTQAPLVAKIMDQRRAITTVAHGTALGTLESRLTMLEALERRLARAGKRVGAPHPQIGTLPLLRKCVEDVGALADRVRTLEDAVLTKTYQGEPIDSAAGQAELAAIAEEFSRLLREVFRRSHPEANDVLLAFYSEHSPTLLEFAAAYHTVGTAAGRLVGMECFTPPPSGRSAQARVLRQSVGRPGPFFAEPPAKLIGLVMHLSGDLLQARFAGEAGLHRLQDHGIIRECLIEVAAPPTSKYTPPKDIERQGGIAAQGQRVIRYFNRDGKTVKDVITTDERAWRSESLAQPVADLSEQQLARRIWAEVGF